MRQCRCSSVQINRYRSKISSPLLDRIDIHLEVSPISEQELMNKPNGEASSEIRCRVEKAREVQEKRYGHSDSNNTDMGPEQMQEFCPLDDSGRALLKTAISTLDLSA